MGAGWAGGGGTRVRFPSPPSPAEFAPSVGYYNPSTTLTPFNPSTPFFGRKGVGGDGRTNAPPATDDALRWASVAGGGCNT